VFMYEEGRGLCAGEAPPLSLCRFNKILRSL
jgi:hypothetical protein